MPPSDDLMYATREDLANQLRAEQETNLILQEAMVDLELALEDTGWRKLSNGVRDEFSPEGRRRIREMCRTMVISNPLMKRAVTVRIGYIWGQGVKVAARAGEDDEQDVNAIVELFWEDNQKSLTGSQAQEELERALGTDGEVYLALFTNPLTGRVQVRSTPTDEIVDIISNPEDRDEPWFYVREYVTQVLEAGYAPGSTRTRSQTVRVVHPALGYVPAQRIKSLNGAEVRWDAPIHHVPVNRLDGWKYGVPDVYASIAWARLYKEYLVDWALLAKSLAKFAWKATGANKTRAQQAAQKIKDQQAAAATTTSGGKLPVPPVGQVAVGDAGTTLEAIPKTGAQVDADSGKPLAAMAAAGVGLPVTILLADPGHTGARAVAETLDLPTILEMTMRRMLWQTALEQIVQHAIDSAVLAPRGTLRGTATIDAWGRKIVTLAGETERTLEFDWPPLVDIDPVELIKAIVEADSTGKMPPLTTVRLLLTALGVKDPEEVIAEVTDDQGNFVDPRVTAGDVAVEALNDGRDPAGVIR